MSEFDEDRYVRSHQEIGESAGQAVSAKVFESFSLSGYFEDTGVDFVHFDEEWYLRKYSDVADAVAAGEFPSGRNHYVTVGALEWRGPNESAEADLEIWRKAINL